MSGDSIDRVIEEWEAEPGRRIARQGDVLFVRGAGCGVAAWRRAGPEAVLLGYLGYLTPESDHGFQWREAEVKDLRAALGLPAWVAPPAPTQEEEPTYPCHEIRVGPISGSFTAERARFSGFSVPPWSDDSELGRVERAEAAEGALTIRFNPNTAESIPGTDWQVGSPGQYSSHPNARAAWIEAGIVLGVLDDGEGVAGLTRELLTRVEQIEALLVKRAQELEEARKEIEWLKRAWMACRRVICEMSDVQAAREELVDATRRLSAAQAERHEAEREPNDQW